MVRKKILVRINSIESTHNVSTAITLVVTLIVPLLVLLVVILVVTLVLTPGSYPIDDPFALPMLPRSANPEAALPHLRCHRQVLSAALAPRAFPRPRRGFAGTVDLPAPGSLDAAPVAW